MSRKTPRIEKLLPIEKFRPDDIKKRIREGFDIYKRTTKREKESEDSCNPALFDFDHAMQERRTKALLNTIDRFVKYDLFDEWLFLNITTDGYSRLENDYHLLFAASIWILDRLSEKNRDFGELYRLLPNDIDMVYDSLDVPDIWDSCYETDLISSVEYVLHYRNADISPLEDDGIGGEKVFTSALSAKSKDRADVPSRQRFEKLISLIPQDKIDSAVSNFTEYYNAWCERLFNCMKPLDDKRTEIREKLNKIREKINKENENAEKLFKQIKEENKRKSKKPSKMPFVLGVSNLPDLLSDNEQSDLLSVKDDLYSKMELLIQRLEKIENEHDTLNEELRKQDTEIHQLAYYIRNAGYIEYDLCLKRYGQEVADAMIKLPTPDPYEMCFALLYLTEQNSDLVWLYGAGRGVMLEAVQHLPWSVYEYDEMDDPYWFNDEPILCKSADIPDWYSLDYYDKNDVIPRNLAQIVYEETGCIMPRDLHKYDSCVSTLRRYGIRQNKAIAMLYCMSALSSARRIRESMNFDADYMEYENSRQNNDTIPAKSETHSAKTEEQKEIERLKAALHAAQRSAAEAQKKLSEQKSAAEAEHRELADLRELLFRGKDDDNDENAPAADESIFPYEVKHDTLVFGGHETWIKALKPMLKGKIRFVSKELVFDISIIRSAEVIWIQTNAIPHKAYNRIVDAARKHSKPVRYFMYASAAKCAEQIAENDRK